MHKLFYSFKHEDTEIVSVRVLYGEGTEAYEKWREETTMEFLKAGFELLEERLNGLEREERTDREWEFY